MSERKQEYLDRGVEVIAVNVFEDPDTVREWLATSDLDYRWAFADDIAREALGIEAIPTQVILDREGRVAWTSSFTSLFGGADAVFEALDRALAPSG